MAEAKDAGKYAAEPEFTLGQVRVQRTRGFDYFYVGAEATMERLASTIDTLRGKLESARRKGRVVVLGPATFVYLGADPSGPFTLQIGYPVESRTAPIRDTKVRHLEDLRCVSVVYSGGLQHIRSAWGAVGTAVKAKGLRTTPESREVYLYFEDDESPNNVTLLQQGVTE
jgi:effector-binding domain-containing protein